MKTSQSLSGKRFQKQSSKLKNRGKSAEHVEKDILGNKDPQKSSDQVLHQAFMESAKEANQAIYNNFSNMVDGDKTEQNNRSNAGKEKKDISLIKQEIRPEYHWQFMKCEKKRNISGYKAKFKWANLKDSNWIIVRSVITDNYFKLGDPDYFIEIDSADIDINLQQQKRIQKLLNQQVEIGQTKHQEHGQSIFIWLKNALVFCNDLFLNMRLNQRPKSKQIQFKRSQVNPNYILYPCPASITWSPHGLLCLSQNKVSNFSKPIIGNVHSYRNLIETPYKSQGFAKRTNEIEDLQLVDERRQQDSDDRKQQETTQNDLYGWDVKQQINFLIFGKSKDQDRIQQSSRKDSYNQSLTEKPEKKFGKDHQTFYLGNTINMPLKLQKIYRRYFLGFQENQQFQFFQKLKIFTVKSPVVQMQDGILYLVEKIHKTNRNGVMESLVQNQFSGYSNIFSKSDKDKDKIHFQKLKYELITEFLQQKIKLTPQSQHFLYLKCIMIENEFFRLALENYLEQNFKRLKIFDNKYGCLGTYDNFDDVNAEKALFQLLAQHLKQQSSNRENSIKIKNKYFHKSEKYDDEFYKQKKYKKIEQQNQQMKLLLKGYVKKKSKHLPELLQVEPQPVFKKMSSQNLEQKSQQKINLPEKLPENKSLNRNVNLNLMPFLVVNKVQFIPFHFNMILTPIQRRNLIDTVIPILWIKDRSSQKFQYKLAKRIIIANSKIINFLQIIGNIDQLWKKKNDPKKKLFLKQILQNYTAFKQKSDSPIGKVYIAYCKSCWGDFTAYSIEQLLRVTLCSRCKYMQQIN